MPDRSPESKLSRAQFASAMVWIRHVVDSGLDEKDAEFFFRELNTECRKLVLKFRKGNELSKMLHQNSLARQADTGIQSAAEG